MSTIRGYGILFGNGSTSGTIGGLGTLTLLQTDETNAGMAEKESIRNGSGDTASVIYYDHKSRATLEFVVNGGTNASTLTVSSWPTAGNTLALTDTQFTPIAGTWIVDENGSQLSRSNTNALRARINLEKFLANSIP